MQDAILSFLLFLAASALIIIALLPIYAVLCGLRRGWVHYRDSYRDSYRRKYPYGTARPNVLWWLITRFFAPWFAVTSAVLSNLVLGGSATDIAATRVHNLASALSNLVCLLILVLCVLRAERSGEYPRFSEYFQSKKILRGIAVVFAVLCALYVGGLSQWLRGENVHKRAKLYFVAGENLNGFRRMLVNHPDNWKMRPLNALQRVIFNRAARLVPDDDGEAAAWENRWFWRHYGRYVSMAIQPHKEPRVGSAPGTRTLLDRWWRCLEDMGAKPIRDPKARRKLFMLEYHRLAWNAYENIHLLVPTNHRRSNSDASYRIHRMTFEERGARLAPGLVRLVEEWHRTPENRTLIAEHPHTEALGLLTLTLALQNAMESEIRAGTFRCENDSARQYLAARRRFFAPETGRAAYLRVAVSKRDSGFNITDRDGLLTFATEWQDFAQYVLEQRCGLPVPGRIVMRDCRRFREDGDETARDQCLEQHVRRSNDKELQLMLDKLPRRTPGEAAERDAGNEPREGP